MVVGAVDEGDINVGVGQAMSREQASETGADDDDVVASAVGAGHFDGCLILAHRLSVLLLNKVYESPVVWFPDGPQGCVYVS